MGKLKFLIFMCLALVFAVVTWSSGHAAQQKALKGVVKGKVTRDDVAKYLGKITPSEQKAAAKRARMSGLQPGVALFDAQAPGPARAQKGPKK